MVKHGLATGTPPEEKSDTLEPNPNPSNNSLLITPHRLTGPNYLQWSKSVRMFICGRGKEEYLTGEIEAPAKTDAGYKKWKMENHLIMSWLINSMSVEVGENFLLYETAKDVWEAVRETYSSSDNTSELSAIESALHDLRQGELSVTQYYNALTKLWQQLDVFETHAWKCPEDGQRYCKIVEQKRTFKFLLGLNKELDDVRGRVMSAKPFLGLREAFAEIRREESRKKVMMGPPSTSVDGSALLGSSLGTTGATQQERRKSRPTCEHCSKPGHTKNTCWVLHGKPSDWKSSRPPAAKTNRGLSVQSSGDQANDSPFSPQQIEALQQIMSATLAQHATGSKSTSLHATKGTEVLALISAQRFSGSWIVDSGASDHMTGNRNLFTTYQPNTDSLHVRIADGTKSRIAGFGSVQISSDLTLKSVLHVPSLDCNLLSISKLTTDEQCSANFFNNVSFPGVGIDEDDWQC